MRNISVNAVEEFKVPCWPKLHKGRLSTKTMMITITLMIMQWWKIDEPFDTECTDVSWFVSSLWNGVWEGLSISWWASQCLKTSPATKWDKNLLNQFPHLTLWGWCRFNHITVGSHVCPPPTRSNPSNKQTSHHQSLIIVTVVVTK